MTRWRIKYPWRSREFKDFTFPVRETFMEVSFFPLKVRVPLFIKIRYLFLRCAHCGKGFSWGYIPSWHHRLKGLYHFDCLDGLIQEDKHG